MIKGERERRIEKEKNKFIEIDWEIKRQTYRHIYREKKRDTNNIRNRDRERKLQNAQQKSIVNLRETEK